MSGVTYPAATMKQRSLVLTVLVLAAGCDDASDGAGGSGGASGSTSSSSDATTSSTTTSSTTASSTTTTTGSTSSGAVCTPGTTEPCYTGPVTTKDVGICTDGVRTCDASGAFGACTGEILPATETCATPEDEDCDGQVNEEGALCVCAPNAMVSCYDGPANTMGVGPCASGLALCDAQGLTLGACEGQVLPAAENCIGSVDEDCDGGLAVCTGDALWAKRFGDVAAQRPRSVAAFPDGGVIVTGAFAQTIDLGGGTLMSGGSDDVFLARFDAAGNHVWSKRFGNSVAQSGISVAVDAQGNVIVMGDYAGTIDPGGGILTSQGATDVFVAKYDSAGAFLWARSFGSAAAQNAGGVAVDDVGDVIVTGSFNGAITFGATVLLSAGSTDMFLAKLDAVGNAVWSKRFGDTAAQVGVAVAAGPANAIALTGTNAGSVDFGSGALMTAGGTDVVLAHFDAAGAPSWAHQFGNSANQTAVDVAIDAVGDVVTTGAFAGSIDLGGGNLTAAGGNDIYLGRFSAAGTFLWAKRFGASGADAGRGVAVDPFGAVILVGDFSGTVNFDGGALMSAGSTDLVVAKFDPLGNHVWSKRAGDGAAQTGEDVAATATALFVAGTFAGTIDLGTGALISSGATDVLLASLLP